jgi:hypothetical protein
MRSHLPLSLLAAVAAVFLSCGPRDTPPREYFTVRSRGDAVGRISRGEPAPRRDFRGAFVLTAYRLQVRRWDDERGVVDDELALTAARRPGKPARAIPGA